jgi:hypothetical protein
MEVSMEVDEYVMAYGFSVYAMEMGSILAASAMLTFGSVASLPGVPPKVGTIWVNAVAQVGTTFVFSSFEFIFGNKFHNYQWDKVYPKSVLRLLAYVLFCPKHYEDHGILLEQCDRDTMFQHINLTSFLARPRHQAVDGGPNGWFEFGSSEL